MRADAVGPGTEFPFGPGVVVNATGVWADDVRALDEGRPIPAPIRPAKGVHVTVPAERLPCDIAAVIPVPQDRRSIFVVLVARHGPRVPRHYRHRLPGTSRRPVVHAGGRRLPPDAANNVTTSQLTRADVTGVWAGCARLLAPPDKAGHVSERTADLSRRHTVRTSSPRRRDRDGWQAHDLPEDGAGHGRLRRAPARGESPKSRRCVTKSLRLIGATTATKDPVAMAHPRAHLVSGVTGPSPPPCSHWPKGGPSCSSR